MRKAKTNTAMVYNPARNLTGVTKTNPAKKRRKRTRKNPAKRRVLASSHRRRNPSIRNNPASLSGLLGAALMVGLGITLFDIIVGRFSPFTGGIAKVGTKFGGAYLFQTGFGSKIPVLGKYKNEIALVLAVSGVVDLMKMFIVPMADNLTGGLLTGGQPQQLVSAPVQSEMSGLIYIPDDDDDDDETGEIVEVLEDYDELEDY